MSPQYQLSNRAVMLDKNTVIASGGEAVIHRDPDHPRSRAVKIYHNPDRARSQKLEWMLKSNLQFPAGVMAPLELVRDTRGTVVGFSMRLLGREFAKYAELFKPSFCRTNGITTKVKAGIGLSVAQTLSWVHGQKLCIGDLNDGALMADQKSHEVAWVDVDSWHTPQFPCVVGTQLYLCPALYNIDLSTGSYFEPWHDWWSYCVLLIRSLLGVHPFKAGTHPQYNSVMERAPRGLSVFDTSVKYPPNALKPEVLTDELLEAVIRSLTMKDKGPLPLKLLEEYDRLLVACPSCGVWYPASRKRCPACSEKTVIDMTKLLGVIVSKLLETGGSILHVQLAGDTLYCVFEENGHLFLYHSNSRSVIPRLSIPESYEPNIRFGVFANHLVVCRDESDEDETGTIDIYAISSGGLQHIKQTNTGIFSGKAPTFATSSRFLYRLATNMLMRSERFGASDLLERPVCQILKNQCWFFCDPDPSGDHETLIGLNRDLGRYDWFVSVSDARGEKFTTREARVAPLLASESMLEVDVRFSGDEILVMRKTRYRGAERTRVDVVNAMTGSLTQSEVVDISSQPHWEQITGKAYMRGQVMHATEHGIVREKLADHSLIPVPSTDSLVVPGHQLFSYRNGILSVGDGKVELISKR